MCNHFSFNDATPKKKKKNDATQLCFPKIQFLFCKMCLYREYSKTEYNIQTQYTDIQTIVMLFMMFH